MNQYGYNPHPIPSRYLSAPASCVSDARLLELGSSWNGVSGRLLLGPSGTGKTVTAARAGAAQVKYHTDTWVKWIRADELSRIMSVRGGVDDIETLKLARVLVIDELGWERWPELVLEVIGSRHDWERPMIVTCGLTLDEFIARYGEATARRISETGGGSIVNLWPAKEALHANS